MKIARWMGVAVVGALALVRLAGAQTGLDAYKAWLAADQNKSLKAFIFRGDDGAEAQRLADLLSERGLRATVYKREEIPTCGVEAADLVILTRDTIKGVGREQWGTDQEVKALKDAHKPILGIGEGLLGYDERVGLPIILSKSKLTLGEGIARSSDTHATFVVPKPLPTTSESMALYVRKGRCRPVHRSALSDRVFALATDPGAGKDFALVAYQHPGVTYWGLDGPAADLTPPGQDYFANVALWTVWASKQTDVTLLKEGLSGRASPTRPGDRVVELSLTRSGGASAKSVPFVVEVFDPSINQWIEFAKGVTNDSGDASLRNITGGAGAERYRVRADGAESPATEFSITEADPTRRISARMPPAVTDPAPDLLLRAVADGETAHLSDFRGSVYLLIFWSSWCEPCQDVVKRADELCKAQVDAWHTKARILAVSVDPDQAKIRDHVAKTGWNTVEQLWMPTFNVKQLENPGTLYGFSNMPTAFLVDAKGIIRWRGNPATLDMKTQIQKLVDEAK